MRQSGLITFKFQEGEVYKKILDLDFEHQVTSFQVQVSSHAHMSGLYKLPIPYFATDVKRTIDDVERSFSILSDVGFLKYDHINNYIWVIHMTADQGCIYDRKNNTRRGTITYIKNFPECQLKHDLIKFYGIVDEIYADNTQGLPKGFARASQGVTKPPILSNPILESLEVKIPKPENPEIIENLELPGELSNG